MGDPQEKTFSYPLYRDIRDGNSVFTSMLVRVKRIGCA